MEDLSVTSITEAAVAEDFSFVTLVFSTGGGSSLRLRVDAAKLSEIVSRLSQLVTYVQSRTLSKGDHFVSHALDATDATAAPVANSKKLILSVKSEKGVVFEFALELSVARRLREEMQDAEKKLSDRLSHTRH
jgi:hypothetical protein